MREKVKIMGILNVTPDSFSDGGQFFSVDAAAARALLMVREGADIIDVGGESSGPGSSDVSEEEELRRVIPVISLLRKSQPALFISIDTYKAEVARLAIAAGASMVNDVTALRGDPQMAHVIAQTGVPVVLMYSKDKTARTTRLKKCYRDVVKTVRGFLEERVTCALRAGIKREQIILDPGMGAFVSGEPRYSFEILERLEELKELGFPILVGVSRKSFLGGAVNERLAATLKANALAIKNGADILRVHDVKAHTAAFRDIIEI